MLGEEVCSSCLRPTHGVGFNQCREMRRVRWYADYGAAVVQRVDEIPSDKQERLKGLWTSSKSRNNVLTFYVTCIWCGSISDLSSRIQLNGYCIDCSICPGCLRHVFYVLDGWRGWQDEGDFFHPGKEKIQ